VVTGRAAASIGRDGKSGRIVKKGAAVSSFSDLTDVYLEIGGGVALSKSLVATVNEACGRVEEDERKGLTLLVHITGGHPGAGDEPWPHETAIHLVNQWERALRRLERLPVLVLAVVDGVCRGPAFDLLLATDYRVATADVSLELVGVAGGAWPGMALYRLVNQVGVGAARRMVVLGTPVTATRAAGLGLVDEVAEDAVARVRAVLQSAGGAHGRELAIRRQLLFEAAATSFEDALGTHLAACDRALRLARGGVEAAPAAGVRL
jgi:isomerase DpgB